MLEGGKGSRAATTPKKKKQFAFAPLAAPRSQEEGGQVLLRHRGDGAAGHRGVAQGQEGVAAGAHRGKDEALPQVRAEKNGRKLQSIFFFKAEMVRRG